MSATGSWRSTVARHVRGPCPARHNPSSLVIGPTLTRSYSTQKLSSHSTEAKPEAGPSISRAAETHRSTTKKHPEASDQPSILLHPSPVINRFRRNPIRPPAQPLRIPFPHPQTRFEEGFSYRLRTRGLDEATKYLIKVLEAKHTSKDPKQPLKPLGVTQEFLDKVLCALRLSAATTYAPGEGSKWLWAPVPMPQKGRQDSRLASEEAPAKALIQVMTLLQIVRDSGRPRPQEHYAALIKAFLARGHVEEAIKLYVELVLDWNVQLASGGKAVSSFAADASDDTKRALKMISRRGDYMNLKRDMPAQIRKETAERGVMPFPQAGMLNAICKHLEANIQAYISSQEKRALAETTETTKAHIFSQGEQALSGTTETTEAQMSSQEEQASTETTETTKAQVFSQEEQVSTEITETTETTDIPDATAHSDAIRPVETTNIPKAKTHPKAIPPSEQQELFRALRNVRVLSTLLYHNQLPYGTTYRSYEPLARVMKLVPFSPLYTIEVVMSKIPRRMKKGRSASMLAKADKAEPVIRTSLHLFTGRLLRAIPGKKGTVGPAAAQEAVEQEASTVAPSSVEGA